MFNRFRLMRVAGNSMAPALREGNLVLVDESAYKRKGPRRNDLAAIRLACLNGKIIVKRINGLPGEQCSYGSSPHQNLWCGDLRLGQDEYFVRGDFASDSLDSRSVGPIRREELVGRVQFRCWPPRILPL